MRRGLIVCEVALCMVLLLTAGALIRTFTNLRNVESLELLLRDEVAAVFACRFFALAARGRRLMVRAHGSC